MFFNEMMRKKGVCAAASRSDKTFSDSTSPELGLKKSSKAAESIEFELLFPAKPEVTSAIFIFCSLKRVSATLRNRLTPKKFSSLISGKLFYYFLVKKGFKFCILFVKFRRFLLQSHFDPARSVLESFPRRRTGCCRVPARASASHSRRCGFSRAKLSNRRCFLFPPGLEFSVLRIRAFFRFFGENLFCSRNTENAPKRNLKSTRNNPPRSENPPTFAARKCSSRAAVSTFRTALVVLLSSH